MKRIQLVVAAITALFALTALATTAMATEKTKVLPQPTAAEPISATASSGAGKLVQLGKLEVNCKKDKGEVAFTSFNLGTGKITFEECKGPLGSTCTGETDTAGSGIILTEGTIHYLLALEMIGTPPASTLETLVGALVILQHEFHFTCEALGQKQLVLVRGCVAAKDDSAELLTKTVLLLFQQWITGETKILLILPPEATKEVNCLLESSINGAAFTLSALEGSGLLEKWIKHETTQTKEIEVLLMNK